MVQENRTITLAALRSFHSVASLGGVSAAATRLGLAKSGVSRHVAQLEAQLGVRLLERGARSVKLTPVGARLHTRIRSILAEVDLLSDIAREESGAVSGRVTVAATPEFGGLLATRFFPAVREHHPGLQLTLRPSYAFEDMQDPRTDLAFRVGSFDDDRLVARQLGAFRSWVVSTPALARAAPVSTVAELARAPCLIFRSDQAHTVWHLFSHDAESSVDVSGHYSARSLTILYQWALAGLGYALLPHFMLTEALASGALVRSVPAFASKPMPVFLSYRPGSRGVARLDAVLSLAEREVPALLEAVGGD
ncbi:MAG: LysR family transcriptional regulator [Pseudomonadota bacterium]